jgi:hypothetical protein
MKAVGGYADFCTQAELKTVRKAGRGVVKDGG